MGLKYLDVVALALDPTGATTLYAGTSGGVWQWTTVLEADLSLTSSLSVSHTQVPIAVRDQVERGVNRTS